MPSPNLEVLPELFYIGNQVLRAVLTRLAQGNRLPAASLVEEDHAVDGRIKENGALDRSRTSGPTMDKHNCEQTN